MNGRLWLFALKVGSLLASCGGPMVVYDQLKPSLGAPFAFALMFAPTALLIFGAFSLRDADVGALGRSSVGAGTLGAVVLGAMNVHGAWVWLAGPERADGALIGLGIAVGVLTIAIYLRHARAYYLRARN